MSDVERVARAICSEQCAVYGDKPCWSVIDPETEKPLPWPPEGCGEVNCKDLARAAIAAMPAPKVKALEADIERLKYVLGGVQSAIKTGRNEPLKIWSEQIDIALSAMPAPAWQPIETAPKDGTEMLGYYPASDGEAEFFDVMRWIDWPKYMNAEGWTINGVNPTHWTPLPDAPAALETKEVE